MPSFIGASGVERLDKQKVFVLETGHSMNLDPNQLPDDPTLLRGVISQLLGAMERLERKNAGLQAEVEALFRKLFRKRSEKLDPRQLELVFEAMRDLGISQHQLEQLELEVTVPPRQRRGAPTRQPLAKDLPRERVEHALPESERCCARSLRACRAIPSIASSSSRPWPGRRLIRLPAEPATDRSRPGRPTGRLGERLPTASTTKG
jgi:hypothetical protein